MSRLGQSTLRELREGKKARMASNSVAKLKFFRTAYEHPLASVRQEPSNQEEGEGELSLKLTFN
jgi:hypothetical protein